MTDHEHHSPHPGDLPADQLDALASRLGSEAVWAGIDPAVEERVVQQITAEVASRPRVPAAPGIEDRRHLRIIGAVAGLFLILGVGIALLARGGDGTEMVALAGTELAEGASATADIDETPSGVRVLLDVANLPPAEEGRYYQGWLRNDDGDAVTIGTFHLRGGDAEIELWAGVRAADYPVITVTIQDEGAGPASSGLVVLRGRLDR